VEFKKYRHLNIFYIIRKRRKKKRKKHHRKNSAPISGQKLSGRKSERYSEKSPMKNSDNTSLQIDANYQELQLRSPQGKIPPALHLALSPVIPPPQKIPSEHPNSARVTHNLSETLDGAAPEGNFMESTVEPSIPQYYSFPNFHQTFAKKPLVL